MADTVEAASVLWIDADPVFGGSRSQIQFPIELGPFFRLPTNAVKHTFEMRSVLIAGILFPHKKMDLHHNDVWRINLPTPNQGLGDYAGKILVFEKTPDKSVYRLTAVNKGGALARKLRTKARTEGQLGHRLREDGSPREYGLF
jgi:hypothetical protein